MHRFFYENLLVGFEGQETVGLHRIMLHGLGFSFDKSSDRRGKIRPCDPMVGIS